MRKKLNTEPLEPIGMKMKKLKKKKTGEFLWSFSFSVHSTPNWKQNYWKIVIFFHHHHHHFVAFISLEIAMENLLKNILSNRIHVLHADQGRHIDFGFIVSFAIDHIAFRLQCNPLFYIFFSFLCCFLFQFCFWFVVHYILHLLLLIFNQFSQWNTNRGGETMAVIKTEKQNAFKMNKAHERGKNDHQRMMTISTQLFAIEKHKGNQPTNNNNNNKSKISNQIYIYNVFRIRLVNCAKSRFVMQNEIRRR